MGLLLIVVLLVEDELADRYALRLLLNRAGYHLVVASSEFAAMQTLTDAPGISVLITDVQLGEKGSGIRLARMARALRPTIAVLYVTAYETDLGVPERVLRKPVSPEDLLTAVQNALSEAGQKASRKLHV